MEGGALTGRFHAGLSSCLTLTDREFQAAPKASLGKKEEASRVAAMRIMLDNLESSESPVVVPEEGSHGTMDLTASLRIVLDKLRESMAPIPEKAAAAVPAPNPLFESLPKIKYDEQGRTLKLVREEDIEWFKERRKRPPVPPVDHRNIDAIQNAELRESTRRSSVRAYEALRRMRATEEDIMRQYDIHGYAYWVVPEQMIKGPSITVV